MSNAPYGSARANAPTRLRLLFVPALLLTVAACALLLSPLAKSAAGDAGDVPANAGARTHTRAEAAQAYGKLPLQFEANAGQTDERVRFTARGVGYTLFLTGREAVLTLREPARAAAGAAAPAREDARRPFEPEATTPVTYRVLRMKLAGATTEPSEVVGLDELPGKFNYFVGNDPAKWRAGVPSYAKVFYRGVYPGIDLVYYGNQRQLEYDFLVAPGADPRAIRLEFDGADRATVDGEGALVLETPGGEVRMRRPVVYQPAEGGERREIEARFVVTGKNSVSFSVGEYDRGRPLVIDPILSYSTYVGSGGNEYAYGIAVDAAGSAYVTGTAESSQYPTTGPVFTTSSFSGGVFVTKLSPSGGELLYSTLVGSSSDAGLGIAVDAQGAAYVTGRTSSQAFPTVNAFKSRAPFYTSADGADSWSNASTGLPVELQTIAVDPSNPSTMYAAYQGVYKSTDGGATWAKLPGTGLEFPFIITLAVNPSNPSVVYAGNISGAFYRSTDGGLTWAAVSLPAPSNPVVRAVEFDPTNASNIFLATANGLYKSTDGGATWAVFKSGMTNSNLLSLAVHPQTPSTLYAGTFGGGVYKTTNGGADWMPANTGISGGLSGYISALAIDPSAPETVYLGTGYSGTAGSIFKTTNGGASWSPANNGVNSQAGITALVVNRTTTSTVYAATSGAGVIRSTDGGGQWSPASRNLWSSRINKLVAHPTDASRLYAAAGASQLTDYDAFAFKLSPAGDALVYSTYLGGLGTDYGYGVAVDSQGSAHIVGQTTSANFPTAGAHQATLDGTTDAFVTKLSPAGNALAYSTYLGGSNSEAAQAVALDTSGNAYVVGGTQSTNFDTTPGAFQTTMAGGGGPFGGSDAFVTKFSAAGALAYSTYLGGSGGDELATGVAADSAGSAYVTGVNAAANFPASAPIRGFAGGGDSFVVKLNTAGSGLVYSTFVGGSGGDGARGIALDPSGNAYVAGTTGSNDFPLTGGALKSKSGLFVSGDGARSWSNLTTHVYAQRSLSTAFDPVNPLTAYAGTSLGVFKTTDGGRTWLLSNTGITGSDVVSIAIDPQTPTTLYAATTFVRTGQGVGLFKSTNGGASWSSSNAGLVGIYAISEIVIDPTNTQTLYAGTYQGVYKSTDGGANWAILKNLPDVMSLALDPTNTQTLYATSFFGSAQDGLYKTTDGGANWTKLAGGLPAGTVRQVELDPLTPSTVYAVTNGGLYKSTDGGASWTLKRAGNIGGTLAIDPKNPSTLYMAATKAEGFLVKSADGGTHWNPAGPLPYPVMTVGVSPHDPTFVVAGTDTFGVDYDDVFVVKINAAGTAIAYSTLLGGTGDDSALATQEFCTAVAVDSEGAAYVTGGTRSFDFPVTPGAVQPFKRGFDEVFVAKLSASFRITGRVADGGGAPVGGVKVTLSGSQRGSQFTAADGTYEFANIAKGGDYTVSASRVGYAFSPASRTFANISADQTADFTATAVATAFHKISGVVTEAGGTPVPGASVALTGSQTEFATTDGSGRYSFNVPAGGMYAVTVTALGFTFTPPSQSNTGGLAGDLTLNFTGARQDFVVTNTNDSGAGSLRQAINDANATFGLDRIAFNIPGPGVKTITLTTDLPTVSDPVRIDGSTQPGFAGAPIVEVAGNGSGVFNLLRITAGSTIVRSLALNRAGGSAVRLEGAGGNTIEGCYIGVAPSGTTARRNHSGVQIFSGSDENVVGGTTAAARNVISGNDRNGVEVSSSLNRVQGNYIGTDASGAAAIPNGNYGVELSGPGSGNLVGGTEPGARNIISGNGGGVSVNSPGSAVRGNYIGLDASGLNRLANNGQGVESRAASVTIGGTAPGAGNVISGNGGVGVSATGANNRVLGNYIGTDAAGAVAVGNTFGGVTAAVVGGTVPGARNVISGNGGSGNVIVIGGLVQGNYIGTDATGSYALANPYAGVQIRGRNSVVGGTTPAARNVISGNTWGILVTGDGFDPAESSSVLGNYIGTNAAGDAPVPNTSAAVYLTGASGNTIGGDAAGAGNLIAFNTGGVVITSGTRNTVRGNRIFSNDLLGIDHNNDGANANDAGDADAGPNDYQNHPVVTSFAAVAGGATNVKGTLSSTPNAQFTIDLYSNRACDPSGRGEGATPFATTNVATDASGNASFDLDVPAALGDGRVVTATATDSAGNTSEFSPCDATGAAGSVEFVSTWLDVLEDIGALGVRVLRTGGSRGALTVNYSTVPITATAGADYTPVTGTLTFADGETEKTFALPIANDGVTEGEETMRLVLGGTPELEALGGRAVATLHIFDTGTPVLIHSEDVSVVEGDAGQKNAVVTLALSAATGRAVSFRYETVVGPGAATAGADFLPVSGTHTFAPGEFLKQFTIPILGDTFDEFNENILFELTEPTNAQIGHSPFVTIVDDDAPPTVSVTDVTVAEGPGAKAVFNVRLSRNSGKPVTINYSTADGTASAASDYTAATGSVIFTAGQTVKAIEVAVASDGAPEGDETFVFNLVSPNLTRATVADGQGQATVKDAASSFSLVQFAAQSFAVGEAEGQATVTVSRAGDASQPATVEYRTVSQSASERSDFTASFGTLRFAPGETQKTFAVLVTDDRFLESAESLDLVLSNAAGAALGGPSVAPLVINSEDTADGQSPVRESAFDSAFFVRQHYHDFLNREPDAAGLAHWTNEIESCGADAACREVRRINVSAAFFLSIEFQETGFLAYRAYKAAYGDATSPGVSGTVPVIRLDEFLADAQRIGQGVVIGAPGWELLLENNKNAYALEFVQRPRFLAAFPVSMTADEFVAKLEQNAGGAIDAGERAQLVASLGATPADPQKRAAALRAVADDAGLRQTEINRAFVLMQYYGYLRRNPDDPQDTDFRGWRFWLDKLNEFGGNAVAAEMVKAFISSDEYRNRFGR